MKAPLSMLIQPRTDGFIPYCVVAGLVALTGSLAASGLVSYFWPQQAAAVPGWLDYPAPYLRLLVATGMETIAIGALAETLMRLRVPSAVATLTLAISFATLSSALLDPSFFAPNACVYLIAAGSYFAWQERSEWHASAAIAIPILLVNSVGFALEALQGGA